MTSPIGTFFRTCVCGAASPQIGRLLLKMRNAAFQAARRSAKPAQYSKFRRLRNKVVKMIRNAKSSYFKNLNPINKKQFWKAVKCLNKQQSTIPTLHHHGTTA